MKYYYSIGEGHMRGVQRGPMCWGRVVPHIVIRGMGDHPRGVVGYGDIIRGSVRNWREC